MEKGLIFDIRRFSVHDGPGIRTTVFFKGCQLSCWWCHNPESRDLHSEKSVKHLRLGQRSFEREEITGRWATVREVMEEIGSDQVFYEESSGGVTFSGGEPLLQEAFLVELLKSCRQRGIHTAIDTSGYAAADVVLHAASLADLVLFDLKMMDEELHRKYTGVPNTLILDNLAALVRTGNVVVLRFPVIPGITDTGENIREMKEFITSRLLKDYNAGNGTPGKLQMSLLPYHAMAREKYRRFCKTNHLANLPTMEPASLEPLKKEFEEIGLEVSIGG